MNKDEFCKLTGLDYENLNQLDWETISMVYTWHPVISDINGKIEITATLFKQGGIGLLEDMLPTATELCKQYSIIQDAEVQMELLEKKHTREITALKEKHLKETYELNVIRSNAQMTANDIEEKYT